LRADDAWCSEFAFYVINNSTQLTNTCTSNIPNLYDAEDPNAPGYPTDTSSINIYSVILRLREVKNAVS
jgi:hypothetical protein